MKKTMDGNTAAAHVSYAFTEVAGIYPITPSTVMAEQVDAWGAEGRKNLFDQPVRVVEMQSEAGAAGAVHGALQSGALSSTYTASQGLLLMIPNMYKIAGERLPAVFHISARAIASHALSIFGDHSDVMACRQTGFAMLASCNVQEVMDLGGIAHLAAIKSSMPFMHFFDGFRTSHEIQKIDVVDYSVFDKLIDKDAVNAFRKRSLNPERPVARGSAQNPDIFFQAREACNQYYDAIPAIVQDYMDKFYAETGRRYNLYDYYGAPDAENIIVAMGSICDTIEETVDYLNAKGKKTGLVKVRLYRPFFTEAFLKAIPKTVKRIAVIDRTKEPGSIGEPLYQDVCTAFINADVKPEIFAGRYGLGSKDTTPSHVLSIFKNLEKDQPKDHFTVAINDDVTNLSLPVDEDIDTTPEGTINCTFWGLGSDGTVGANKNSIKIIGDNTDMNVQAYFSYDSKKSGGITVSHLRFGKQLIKSPYLVNKADFLACHNAAYLTKYDMVSSIKPGGTFLLNCAWDIDELNEHMPADKKRILAKNNIKFYTIDAVALAKEIGLGGRINTIMQSAFFKLANIIPIDKAIEYMKEAIYKSYGKKGEDIVNMNYAAVEAGVNAVKEIAIPADWANAVDAAEAADNKPEFIKNVVDVINAQNGDSLPVSTFVNNDLVDGSFPVGTSKYEKRGVAVSLPEWHNEKCIGCNQCSYVCPHATIRPFLLTDEEVANAPAGMKTMTPKGKALEGYKVSISVAALDCTGCGNCAQVCPAPEKAITMVPAETQNDQIACWEYVTALPHKENPMGKKTVIGSQFEQPLLEFSGACAGCGETPYAKLITQLFGDRMYIANATGCSSIWGNSAPATPYTTNYKGHGPAWANSLFEDNAEFGLGMLVGVKQQRNRIKALCEQLIEGGAKEECKAAAQAWIDSMDNGEASKATSAALVEALSSCDCACDNLKAIRDEILNNKEHLVMKSQWILGGDGWAYDIGYGGLDHVLASGENVNVLVFDTEVYSNTGGQASKSTPTGAIAKLAQAGKQVKKKDLAMMAMSYGYVYVAQIAMGADYNQCLKAITEAEAYPGPSLIIAYAPCINHGMKAGMGNAQAEIKKAVAAGYWQMFRFNPTLAEQGKNPFTLDSKEPTADYQDYILSQVRYASLKKAFPDRAEELYAKSEAQAKEKYIKYTKFGQLFE